jgi:hypothetical protein
VRFKSGDRVGKGVGVNVSSASVGRIVLVGGRVSVGRGVEAGGGEEQEMRRKNMEDKNTQ